MAAYERYEKNDGEGYGRSGNVDAQIDSLEASYVALPWGEGFEIFTGLGMTDLDVDTHVTNPAVDLQKSTLSLHVGMGYRAALGENLYLRPECAPASTRPATAPSTSPPRSLSAGAGTPTSRPRRRLPRAPRTAIFAA